MNMIEALVKTVVKKPSIIERFVAQVQEIQSWVKLFSI